MEKLKKTVFFQAFKTLESTEGYTKLFWHYKKQLLFFKNHTMWGYGIVWKFKKNINDLDHFLNIYLKYSENSPLK